MRKHALCQQPECFESREYLHDSMRCSHKDKSCIAWDRMQLLDTAAFNPMQLTTADAPKSAV